MYVVEVVCYIYQYGPRLIGVFLFGEQRELLHLCYLRMRVAPSRQKSYTLREFWVRAGWRETVSA